MMGGLAHPKADLLIVYLNGLHIRSLRPSFVPVRVSTFLCSLSLLPLYFLLSCSLDASRSCQGR